MIIKVNISSFLEFYFCAIVLAEPIQAFNKQRFSNFVYV